MNSLAPIAAFDGLTDDLATRLNSQLGFDTAAPAIPVLTERLSDMTKRVTNALLSAGGLCVVIGTPALSIGEQPEFLTPRVTLHIYENALVNRTDLHAFGCAALCYLALLRYAPAGGWSALLPESGGSPIKLIGLGEAEVAGVKIPNLVTYEVTLSTWQAFTTIAAT